MSARLAFTLGHSMPSGAKEKTVQESRKAGPSLTRREVLRTSTAAFAGMGVASLTASCQTVKPKQPRWAEAARQYTRRLDAVYDGAEGRRRLAVTDRIIRVTSQGVETVRSPHKPQHSWGETAAAFNGSVFLVAGGRGEDAMLSTSAVLFDPDLEGESIRPMPAPRARHVVVPLEDRSFLVVGGVTIEDDDALALARSIWRYEPFSDSWEEFADLPLRTAGHVAERIGDKVYVIAGDTGSMSEPEWSVAPARCRAEVQILDLSTGKWTMGSPKPSPETGVTSAVRGNELYVISSYDDTDSINALVEVYDVAVDSWRALPSMPTPRTNVPAAFLNGTLYCINGLGRGRQPLSLTEVFDPDTEVWAKAKLAPPACYACGYARLDDSTLILFGGRVADQYGESDEGYY